MEHQPIAQEVIIIFEDGRTGVFFGPVAVDREMKESGIQIKEVYFVDLVSAPPPEESKEPEADIERVNGLVN